MTRQRVGAVDCGTHSIRLLIADFDPDGGRLVDVERRMEIVRLGQGVDQTGRLDDDALARTFTVVDSFASSLARHRVTRVRFVATSATRDASNREAFIAGVRDRLEVDPEVVSGEEEATLSFDGATHELIGSPQPRPLLVVDIGGGSTEFVVGDASSGPTALASIDIGCVRVSERHFTDDPPKLSEIAAARVDIDEAVRRAATRVPLRSAGTLIGLAGSVTTVAAIALALERYDPRRIHGSLIDAADIHRICESLLFMDRARRAAIPVMHPGRVDVIAAGALVLSAVVAYVGVPRILVSEHDILDGIAWSLVEQR